MIKALKFSLLVTVFLIPIITPFQNFGYEHSKILFFIFLTSLSGFLWLGRGFKWSGISKASAIFILILLLTSLFGVDPLMGMVGKEPYFQGWIIYAYLWLFSVMVAGAAVKQKDWIKALSLSSALVSVVALRQFIEINFLGHHIPTYAGRVVSTFGQPNFYSGFLLLTLPLIPRKGYWWLVIILNIVAILLSESKIAIFLLLLLLIGWLVWLKKSWLMILLSLMILLGMKTVFQQEILLPLSDQWLIDNAPEKRLLIYPVMAKLVTEKFFFGYGLENIDQSYSSFFNRVNFNLVTSPADHGLKNLSVDRSHNYILDLLLFSGVAGTLVWLGLMWLLFKKAKNNKVLLISLVTYLIWIQFQNQSLVHLIYFWLLVGIIDQHKPIVG